MMMMKPWQAPSNKAPGKGGNEEQRERTQVQARRAKPKVGSKGHSIKLCSSVVLIVRKSMVVGSMECWSGMDFEHITQSYLQIVIALG